MDIIYTLLGFLTIYAIVVSLPLVCLPRLLLSWEGRLVLPVTGMALLGLLFWLTSLFYISRGLFLTAIITLMLLGFYRVHTLLNNNFDHKNKQILLKHELPFYTGIILFIAPIAITLLFSAFGTNDEIYSWNYWATQFFHHEKQDLYFTSAPYPAFFSHYIAAIYTLFGSTEYQSLAKFSLIFLPLTAFSILMALTMQRNSKSLIAALVLMLLFLYGMDYRNEFKYGLADPMMSVFLLSGFFLLLRAYEQKPDERDTFLYCSSFLISVAALTKQAAFPWAALFYPITALILAKQENINLKAITLAFLPLITTAIWISTAQDDFTNNVGVISASLQGRHLLEQLIFSLNNYFIKNPLNLAVLLFLTVLVLRNASRSTYLLLFGTYVSIVLWLLFGAYQFRLGMHAFLLLWLIAYCQPIDTLPNNPYIAIGNAPKFHRIITIILISLSLSYTVERVYSLQKKYAGESLLNGRQMQMIKIVGKPGKDYLIKNIAPETKVWVDSNYLYGFLYKAAKVAKPPKKPIAVEQFSIEDYDIYLFSNDVYRFGGAGSQIKRLIQKNKHLYSKEFVADTIIGMEVYKRIEH